MSMDINNDSEKGEKESLKASTSDGGMREQKTVWDTGRVGTRLTREREVMCDWRREGGREGAEGKRARRQGSRHDPSIQCARTISVCGRWRGD